MNYNLVSIPKQNEFLFKGEPITSLPLCTRAKLDTGTFCNLACTFCYYKDQLDKMDSYETIMKRLDYIKEYNLITEIELSGGESSVHPDWFKLLQECSKHYKHISTLSNGTKFKNNDFLLKSKEYGLKEIMFSVHGYNLVHDKITNKKGSFLDIQTAINNSLNNGLITRINCTVCSDNYKTLSKDFTEYILTLIDKGLTQLNFIFLNFWDDNKKADFINYKDLSIEVIKVLDIIFEKYPTFDIRLRYVPFCFFPEKYHNLIYGQFQHLFDTTDWNKEIYKGHVFASCLLPCTKEESLQLGWFAAKEDRLRSYYKPKDCFKCSKFKECDGIEKELKGKQEVYLI